MKPWREIHYAAIICESNAINLQNAEPEEGGTTDHGEGEKSQSREGRLMRIQLTFLTLSDNTGTPGKFLRAVLHRKVPKGLSQCHNKRRIHPWFFMTLS